MAKPFKEKLPAVAVIGCGYWGKNLIRNYHHLGALKLICDKNEAALAAEKPAVRHISSWPNYSSADNRSVSGLPANRSAFGLYALFYSWTTRRNND